MSTWPILGAFAGGALASNVVLAAVVHWIVGAAEIVRSRSLKTGKGGLIGQLVAGSILNAGPWILLVAAFFSFHISAEAWASSFFAGAATWIVFGGVAVSYAMWKRRREPKSDAA